MAHLDYIQGRQKQTVLQIVPGWYFMGGAWTYQAKDKIYITCDPFRATDVSQLPREQQEVLSGLGVFKPIYLTTSVVTKPVRGYAGT